MTLFPGDCSIFIVRHHRPSHRKLPTRTPLNSSSQISCFGADSLGLDLVSKSENDRTGPQTSLAGLCRRRRDRSTSSRGPLVLFGYSKEHPVPDQNSRTGAGGLVIRARLRRLRLDPISTHRLTPLTGRQRHKVGDHLQTGSSALHLPEDCARFRSFSYYHSSTWGQGRWAGIGAWP